MGRPKLRQDWQPKKANEIDESIVQRLAEIGANVGHIAYALNTTEDTLHDHFRRELDAGRSNGDVTILKKQYEVAMKGSVPMLIWLGKQRLGQTDKTQTETMNANFDIIIGEPDTKPANERHAAPEDPEAATGAMEVLE